MGIYLGQLPPAEIARLKAELAETLIANFCYPRFFDHRTESLRMRPVDRSKRQEVWLYLSSVDFTAWSRVDLLSPDFQRHIERLFIQFVQRNRSFFGNQGRRRMSDVRMLISTCAASVSQGLRNHLTGQKPQGSLPFGSPRPVVSWTSLNVNGRSEQTWEHIAPATMLLQQQLQELRGEVKPAAVAEERSASAANGAVRRITSRPLSSTSTASTIERTASVPDQGVIHTPVSPRLTPAAQQTASRAASPVSPAPAASAASHTAAPVTTRKSEPLAQPTTQPAEARRSSLLAQPAEVRKSGPLDQTAESPAVSVSHAQPAPATTRPQLRKGPAAPLPDAAQSAPATAPARNLPQPPSSPAATIAPGQREMMAVGEDDMAIFEQMRHQLLVWLRVEAVSSGLEISGQGPAQLLEMLRQQARLDETRLQVVSTLLNLSNQVIKTGLVSILD